MAPAVRILGKVTLRVVESQRWHEPVPGALLLQRVTSGSLCIQVTVENGMVITLASVAPKRFWEAELTVPGKVQGWRLTHVLHFTQRMTVNLSGLIIYLSFSKKKKKKKRILGPATQNF